MLTERADLPEVSRKCYPQEVVLMLRYKGEYKTTRWRRKFYGEWSCLTRNTAKQVHREWEKGNSELGCGAVEFGEPTRPYRWAKDRQEEHTRPCKTHAYTRRWPQRWPSNTEHVAHFTKVLWTGWASNGMSDSII